MKSLHARWHQTSSFYFTYQPGMAWQCWPDFMLQDKISCPSSDSPLPAPAWHKEKQWCKRSGSQWKFPAHSSVSNRSPPTLPVQWVATHPCPGAICAPRSTHGMGWNLARFCLLSDSLPLLWKADMLPAVDTTELLTPGLKTGKMLLD